MQLGDTIVLMTGAAGGIGRAVCRSLEEAGATVIATDLAAEADVPGAAAYYRHDVEIGGGVVYLCSTAASFVTGSEFIIDGGFTSV